MCPTVLFPEKNAFSPLLQQFLCRLASACYEPQRFWPSGPTSRSKTNPGYLPGLRKPRALCGTFIARCPAARAASPHLRRRGHRQLAVKPPVTVALSTSTTFSMRQPTVLGDSDKVPEGTADRSPQPPARN